MRKIVGLALAAALALGLLGCSAQGEAPVHIDAPAAAQKVAETVAENGSGDNWKVAILTGSASQGEEEICAAQKVLEAYGPEHIVTATYPDDFMSEFDDIVSTIVSFAEDPDMKAIIMCPAVPGAKAGFDQVRQMGRDDILFIAGTPQENPGVISAAADVVMYADKVAQGNSIMETCARWDIDVFVYYTFPRHTSMEQIAERYELLKKNADVQGIEMVEVLAPDPTGEDGLNASRQFILEDVPRQMDRYEGKKVAFFATNCAMQLPLQEAVLNQPDAYYPQPCCPSPYHAFPTTLGLDLEIGGDDEAALEQIAACLAEHDAVERFSTWPHPVSMTVIEVGVEYAKAYIDGDISGKNDGQALLALLESRAPGARITPYTDANGTTFDNYYTILLSPVNFEDYLK